MAIRRIFAADMRQALKQVREQIGPEASIVKQRAIAGGVELTVDDSTITNSANSSTLSSSSNKDQVQLNQALENARSKIISAQGNEALPGQLVSTRVRNKDVNPAKLGRGTSTVQSRRATAGNMGASLPNTNASQLTGEHELSAVRAELNEMKSLLQQQLGDMAWGQFNQRSPVQAKIWRKLVGMGFGSSLCQRLVETCTPEKSYDDAWRHVFGTLTDLMVPPHHDLVDRGGVFAVVGPTGSGKTTTISKLATRFVLKYGADQVGLISTDNFRIGAQEQLQGLARILKTPLHGVDDQKQLQQALDELAGKKLILIDTAGMQQNSDELKLQLDEMNRASPMVRSFLVLPCTSQREVLFNAYLSYKEARLAGMVLTHIDEAHQLGGALSIAINYKLAVSYFCDGQNIPDDIHPAQILKLINMAVKMGELQSVDDPLMVDGFTRVMASI